MWLHNCFWLNNSVIGSMCWKRWWFCILLSLVLTLLDDHQVLQHVEGVSIRLHWDNILLLAAHLEETVVVQTHHLSLQSVLAPETHLSPTEDRAQRATVRVLLQDVSMGFRNFTKLCNWRGRPRVRALKTETTHHLHSLFPQVITSKTKTPPVYPRLWCHVLLTTVSSISLLWLSSRPDVLYMYALKCQT